jgi:tRNA(Leu) C34 or U34 (ribose-2'-O)-methylase TrmL
MVFTALLSLSLELPLAYDCALEFFSADLLEDTASFLSSSFSVPAASLPLLLPLTRKPPAPRTEDRPLAAASLRQLSLFAPSPTLCLALAAIAVSFNPVAEIPPSCVDFLCANSSYSPPEADLFFAAVALLATLPAGSPAAQAAQPAAQAALSRSIATRTLSAASLQLLAAAAAEAHLQLSPEAEAALVSELFDAVGPARSAVAEALACSSVASQNCAHFRRVMEAASASPLLSPIAVRGAAHGVMAVPSPLQSIDVLRLCLVHGASEFIAPSSSNAAQVIALVDADAQARLAAFSALDELLLPLAVGDQLSLLTSLLSPAVAAICPSPGEAAVPCRRKASPTAIPADPRELFGSGRVGMGVLLNSLQHRRLDRLLAAVLASLTRLHQGLSALSCSDLEARLKECRVPAASFCAALASLCFTAFAVPPTTRVLLDSALAFALDVASGSDAVTDLLVPRLSLSAAVPVTAAAVAGNLVLHAIFVPDPTRERLLFLLAALAFEGPNQTRGIAKAALLACAERRAAGFPAPLLSPTVMGDLGPILLAAAAADQTRNGRKYRVFFNASLLDYELFSAAELVGPDRPALDCGSGPPAPLTAAYPDPAVNAGSLDIQQSGQAQRKIVPLTPSELLVIPPSELRDRARGHPRGCVDPDALSAPLQAPARRLAARGIHIAAPGAPDLVVVASLLKSPANLGGLCRTCEIFGAGALVVPDLAVVRDALFKSLAVTSHLWMPLAEAPPADVPQVLADLRTCGYAAVALEQASDSVPLGSSPLPPRAAILLGDEKQGIPSELLSAGFDVTIEIPQFGRVRSLNVHTAASLLVWEFRRALL